VTPLNKELQERHAIDKDIIKSERARKTDEAFIALLTQIHDFLLSYDQYMVSYAKLFTRRIDK
jgi:hypothetical protein